MSVSAGRWLTAWHAGAEYGYLPRPGQSPSWELDRLAGDIVRQAARTPAVDATRPGNVLPGTRWLVVSRRPIFHAAEEHLRVAAAVADTGMIRLGSWQGRSARSVREVLSDPWGRYHGVFYAPVRADHPAAGALFNARALQALAWQTVEGGLLIVHVPCRSTNAAPMLAVARTAEEVFGRCLLAVNVQEDGAEMLIFSYRGATEDRFAPLAGLLRDRLAGHATILSGSDLAGLWDRVPVIGRSPGAKCGGGASVPTRQLSQFLKGRASDNSTSTHTNSRR